MGILLKTTSNVSFVNAFSSKTALSMRASGTLAQVSETGEECKCGQMDLAMRATGKMTRPTVEEDLYMQTVMFMKESGRTTKARATEYTCILTELSIRENG